MLANDIKKGAKLRLKNGWKADMADNGKGNIRMCKVYGLYTEIGSVYTHDIAAVEVNGVWEPVTLSPAQAKKAANIRAMGF